MLTGIHGFAAFAAAPVLCLIGNPLTGDMGMLHKFRQDVMANLTGLGRTSCGLLAGNMLFQRGSLVADGTDLPVAELIRLVGAVIDMAAGIVVVADGASAAALAAIGMAVKIHLYTAVVALVPMALLVAVPVSFLILVLVLELGLELILTVQADLALILGGSGAGNMGLLVLGGLADLAGIPVVGGIVGVVIIEFMLDLHQLAPSRDMMIDIGTGKQKNVKDEKFVSLAYNIFEKYELGKITIDTPFDASYIYTMSSYIARECGISCLQIEMNSKIVRTDSKYSKEEKVFLSLVELIGELEKILS